MPYRAYIESEQWGRIAVPLCDECLPDGADIQGHISDDRHYDEEDVEQPTCYECDLYL